MSSPYTTPQPVSTEAGESWHDGIRVRRSEWRPAPVMLDASEVEVAVGDVHGLHAELAGLVAALAQATGGVARITFLGDLIDRGPRSIAALRLACRPAAALGFAERHLLLGNHEMMLLLALSHDPRAPDAQELWLVNGGLATMLDAGLSARGLVLRPEATAASFREVLGEAEWAVVEAAGLLRRRGNLVFVHAGIDPTRPIAEFVETAPHLSIATEHHPAWIRWEFLLHEGRMPEDVLVVHGHTPEPRVLARKGRPATPGVHQLDGSRLGIDGGSFTTGIVTAAEFRQGRYRVFTASRGG